MNHAEIAQQLTPQQVVDLVQLAATQSTPVETEMAEGMMALQTLKDYTSVETCPNLAPVWAHIQRHLHRPIDTPVTTQDSSISLGASAGTQVIINPTEFDHPDDPWVVMSHEAAHSELGHSVRHQALKWLTRVPDYKSPAFASAIDQERHELELEADYRGYTIIGEKLTQPEKLLESLLLTQGGRDHPDGLTRAENARQALFSIGRGVSPEVWQELLKSTESCRERFQTKALQEAQFRKSLSKFV